MGNRIVGLVVILDILVHSTQAALSGEWLRLRLEGQKVGGEPPFFCFSTLNAIFYFQNSVQISWTLSAFELAKSDFKLQLFSDSI